MVTGCALYSTWRALVASNLVIHHRPFFCARTNPVENSFFVFLDQVGPIRKSEPVSIVKTEPVGDVDRRLILPRFLPAGLFKTVSFPVSFRVLFPDPGLDWQSPVWSGSRVDKRPGRMLAHSPRAIPWERQLPWAPATIIPNTAVVPVSGRPNVSDRPMNGPPKCGGPARGSACAKGASGSISRSVRISVTVRIPTAGARSAAGRRRGDRLAAVRIRGFRPSTLQPNACAVSEPKPRRNLRNERRLRPRVVTQQKFFFKIPLRSAGVLRTAGPLDP